MKYKHRCCALAASALLFADNAGAAAFPAAGVERTYSLGQFTVDVVDDPDGMNWSAASNLPAYGFTWDGAGRLTSPLLFDNDTQIYHGTPYAEAIAGDPNSATKVDTEIKQFAMTYVSSAGVVGVYAGNMAEAGTLASTGLVTSNVAGGGFDAKSTFDVYVNAGLPNGDFLYNPKGQPLKISSSSITSFPPTVVYTHDSSTAVPVYLHTPGAAIDTLFGYLLLAGHGVTQMNGHASTLQEFEQESPEDGALLGDFNSEFASMTAAPLPGIADPFLIQSQYTPVPIPAAAWLLGSGLAGLLAFGRKGGTRPDPS